MNDQMERAGELWQDIVANNLTSDNICSECCFDFCKCNEQKEVCFAELRQNIHKLGTYEFNRQFNEIFRRGSDVNKEMLDRKRPMLHYKFRKDVSI